MLVSHIPSFKVRTDENAKKITFDEIKVNTWYKSLSKSDVSISESKNNDSLISESEIPLNPYPHNSPIKTFNTDNLKRDFFKSVPKSILSNRD